MRVVSGWSREPARMEIAARREAAPPRISDARVARAGRRASAACAATVSRFATAIMLAASLGGIADAQAPAGTPRYLPVGIQSAARAPGANPRDDGGASGRPAFVVPVQYAPPTA